jgi:hypothetical protein
LETKKKIQLNELILKYILTLFMVTKYSALCPATSTTSAAA